MIPKRLVIALALASLGMASPPGCQSVSTPLVVDGPKAHVDASVMGECGTVVDIPHRFLPDDETSRLWARDRATLGDCRKLNHAKATTIKALVQ